MAEKKVKTPLTLQQIVAAIIEEMSPPKIGAVKRAANALGVSYTEVQKVKEAFSPTMRVGETLPIYNDGAACGYRARPCDGRGIATPEHP